MQRSGRVGYIVDWDEWDDALKAEVCRRGRNGWVGIAVDGERDDMVDGVSSNSARSALHRMISVVWLA